MPHGRLIMVELQQGTILLGRYHHGQPNGPEMLIMNNGITRKCIRNQGKI